MGPLSYMRSVVDLNVVMRRITVVDSEKDVARRSFLIFRTANFQLENFVHSGTPPAEWSARHKDLYLTTHTTLKRHPYLRRDSNPQSEQASVRRPTSETGHHWNRRRNFIERSNFLRLRLQIGKCKQENNERKLFMKRRDFVSARLNFGEQLRVIHSRCVA